MYKILKFIFLLGLIIVGGISLKENPSATVFWVIVSLMPIIGITLDAWWGYALACLLSLFVIFALMFNGFYSIGDYLILAFSLLLIALVYPVLRSYKKIKASSSRV